jgi:hypothetical protein
MSEATSDNPYPHGTVKFHQQKGALFRVVHSDGVWCSVGPHGKLHLIFFNERWPIPTETTYQLTAESELGDEIKELREGKDGYFREMEVDVVLDLRNAQALYQYLGEYIKMMTNENS